MRDHSSIRLFWRGVPVNSRRRWLELGENSIEVEGNVLCGIKFILRTYFVTLFSANIKHLTQQSEPIMSEIPDVLTAKCSIAEQQEITTGFTQNYLGFCYTSIFVYFGNTLKCQIWLLSSDRLYSTAQSLTVFWLVLQKAEESIMYPNKVSKLVNGYLFSN